MSKEQWCKCGDIHTEDSVCDICHMSDLAEARTNALEEAAKICDERAQYWRDEQKNTERPNNPYHIVRSKDCSFVAKEIRKLKTLNTRAGDKG